MGERDASEIVTDPEFGTVIINNSGVSSKAITRALSEQHPELASLVRWSTDVTGRSRNGGVFDRDRYLTPHYIFDQFKVAQDAVDSDDIVSGVLESTESLAFSRMSFEAEDEDETDIWNQIAQDIDLDSRMREMWRELFTISQCYVAIWWGRKSYKVRGKSDKGVKRKKTFDNLKVPMGMSILDPLKVIPVGNFLFNQDTLAYAADLSEADVIQDTLNKVRPPDPVMSQLILGKYEPDPTDRRQLQQLGVSVDRLFRLDPRYVFRHTDTRPQYQRFAPVRLRGIFELLDLKHLLRQMDRAVMIGSTNFIILVRKGTDEMPAKPGELQKLEGQMRTLSRVPIIVGDHRLHIEIITPNSDKTLQPDRYNGLDARITARLYQIFMTGNFAAGAKGDDSIKLARVIGRGLESRRHMMRRSLEKHLIRPTYEANEQFTSEANLLFHPKRVALDFDPAFATLLADLLVNGNVSIESVLEELGFDIEQEATRREREKEKYKDIFVPPVLPPGSPGMDPNNSGPPADPKTAGRTRGGIRNGGGAAPGTGQGQAPKRPNKLSDGKAKPAVASDEDGMTDDDID